MVVEKIALLVLCVLFVAMFSVIGVTLDNSDFRYTRLGGCLEAVCAFGSFASLIMFFVCLAFLSC